MFLFLYICFSIFDQILLAYLFFISGFIEGEMGLTYSEQTYRIEMYDYVFIQICEN